jgi:hypothetical protein
MLQPSHFTPSTGLASLAEASPDYELAPVGLASFQDQVKKLAEFGRNGDIYVVHAAEGETVVPMEVLNENPKVKELLFKQMEDMGLDPQEFIVGSDLNSINPVTGLPEFFVTRLFRAVKKAVKSVAKIVKKAAPIVLPIAAAAFGVPFLGPAFGAGTFGASFLGSGIGTLVGGGSFKDALKSGLISGGLAAASTGIGSLIKGGNIGDALTGTFTGATPVYNTAGDLIGTQYAASPFADALGASPARVASAAASDAQFSKLLGGDIVDAFTGEGQLFGPTPTGQAPGFVSATAPTGPVTPSLSPNAAAIQRGREAAQAARAAGGTPGSYQTAQLAIPGEPIVGPPVSSNVPSAASIGPTPQNLAVMQRTGVNPLTGANVNPNPLGFVKGQTGATAKQLTAIDSAAKAAMDAASKDASYFTLGLDNKLLGGPSITAADITKINPALEAAPGALVKAAAENVNPSLLRQAAVPLTVAGGAAALGGAFDVEEVEQPTEGDLEGFVADLGPTGFELFEQDPERYRVANLDPTQFVPSGTPVIPTTFPALLASDGGMAEFPRREMLVEGPGGETGDKIPAMLSDGEFVMNARSVRGADPSGNGSRYAGAKNLYDMMRNFEMRA